MSPEAFLDRVILPGLRDLESIGGPLVSAEAERFLLAIALQESGPDLNARYQSSPQPVGGPAKGWYQFEPAGCDGVLNHKASRELALLACQRHSIVPHAMPLSRALEGGDIMATVVARLLILTYPKALPQTMEEGWQQYLALWRPGKPRYVTWPDNWATATATII